MFLYIGLVKPVNQLLKCVLGLHAISVTVGFGTHHDSDSPTEGFLLPSSCCVMAGFLFALWEHAT